MVLLSQDNFTKITQTHIIKCLTEPRDFKIKVAQAPANLTASKNVNFETQDKTTGRPKQNQSTE